MILSYSGSDEHGNGESVHKKIEIMKALRILFASDYGMLEPSRALHSF